MVVKVDPQVYYDGAKTLTDIGSGIGTAADKLAQALSDTGSMAGTSDAAKKWAGSYDTRARSALDNARNLAATLKYFASLVALAGYNHDLANYRADINPHKGHEPSKPASVDPPIEACWAGPPSSGGPGNGLVSGIGALMEKIHIHIPDGDTKKLGEAAKAWNDFWGTDAVAHAAYDISGVKNRLATVDSPEIYDLLDHLQKMERAGKKLYTAATGLATDCANHKKPLDELRSKIKEVLHTLEEAIAVNLAITIFADVVTAGVGMVLDAASLAKAGKDVDDAATAITDAVEAVQIDKVLTEAAQEEDVLASTGRDLDEIETLMPEDITSEASAADFTPEAGVQADAQTAESVQKKLDGYLLNSDHPVGGAKAKWFQQALGFTRENQSQLESQIVFNPSSAVETGVTEYGTKYNQVIPVTGANGKVIDVNFAWIRNTDGVVRLVTAIPTAK